MLDHFKDFINWYNIGRLRQPYYYSPELKEGQYDLFNNSHFAEVIKSGPVIARCTLKYPFEKSYEIAVIVDNIEHTFEQIYAGMVYMFSQSTVSDIPRMYNKRVKSKFGIAYHTLDELGPEEMIYDSNTNEITITFSS